MHYRFAEMLHSLWESIGVHPIRGGWEEFYSAVMIVILSLFLGYYVIWRVSPSLHAPLMSVTNAISSIIVVPAIGMACASDGMFTSSLGSLTLLLLGVNIGGGLLITYRMLSMFRSSREQS